MSKRVNDYDPNAKSPGVGGTHVWELDQPHACELIKVTEVFWNGTRWITLAGLMFLEVLDD
jgi:hypothetical protein